MAVAPADLGSTINYFAAAAHSARKYLHSFMYSVNITPSLCARFPIPVNAEITPKALKPASLFYDLAPTATLDAGERTDRAAYIALRCILGAA